MRKLLVTGGNGLVGSSIRADIKIGGEFDLRKSDISDDFFEKKLFPSNRKSFRFIGERIGLITKYKELSKSYFEMVDHEFNHSPGWDNDILLILFKK